MEQLEDERHYGVRPQFAWLPEYRLGHTLLLVLLTGIAGWYALYRVATWLLDLLG
jgi:hypothetical protein